MVPSFLFNVGARVQFEQLNFFLVVYIRERECRLKKKLTALWSFHTFFVRWLVRKSVRPVYLCTHFCSLKIRHCEFFPAERICLENFVRPRELNIRAHLPAEINFFPFSKFANEAGISYEMKW